MPGLSPKLHAVQVLSLQCSHDLSLQPAPDLYGVSVILCRGPTHEPKEKRKAMLDEPVFIKKTNSNIAPWSRPFLASGHPHVDDEPVRAKADLEPVVKPL